MNFHFPLILIMLELVDVDLKGIGGCSVLQVYSCCSDRPLLLEKTYLGVVRPLAFICIEYFSSFFFLLKNFLFCCF